MDLHHLTLATDGRRTLFPDETARRTALRALGGALAGRALLFCVVDDHVHVVLEGERAAVGRVAQAIAHRLGKLASAPLDPSRIRPVEDRAHLQSLVRYLLLQPTHHRLAGHPALWTGSCLPDLVGARAVQGLSLRLGAHLPRFHARDACALLGLPDLDPLPGPAVRALGPVRVLAAASAVLAVGPVLAGRDAAVVAARRLGAAAATGAGIPAGEIAWAAFVTRRSAYRHAASPADPALARAVALRLTLEEAARNAPLPPLAAEGDGLPPDLVD